MAAAAIGDPRSPEGRASSKSPSTPRASAAAAVTSPTKRVSFAPAPPRINPGSTVWRAQPGGALTAGFLLAGEEAEGSEAAAAAATDHTLTFLPDVDSPRSLRCPPSPSGLLPSNEALSATNAEMSLLDMSDLPPLQGIPCSPNESSNIILDEAPPGSQPASPASVAVTQLDLLPPLRGQSRQQQQRPLPRREQPRRPRPHRAQALAVLQEEQAAEGQDGSAEQQEEQPSSASALGCDVPLGQPGVHQAAGLLPQHTWLNRVLRRLLSAVATSGSSISQLATTGSGTLTGSALSSSGSADSLHSAASSLESGMERFESCTASDVEEEYGSGRDATKW